MSDVCEFDKSRIGEHSMLVADATRREIHRECFYRGISVASSNLKDLRAIVQEPECTEKEEDSSEKVEKEKFEKEKVEKEKTQGVAVSSLFPLAVPLASETKKNDQTVVEIDSDKTVSEDEEIAVAVPVLDRVSGVAARRGV